MDQEIPEYDMDSEDEQWLNRQVKHLKMDVSALKFESMMDRLEKGSGQMVCIFVVVLCVSGQICQSLCVSFWSYFMSLWTSAHYVGFVKSVGIKISHLLKCNHQ